MRNNVIHQRTETTRVSVGFMPSLQKKTLKIVQIPFSEWQIIIRDFMQDERLCYSSSEEIESQADTDRTQQVREMSKTKLREHLITVPHLVLFTVLSCLYHHT